MLTRVIISRKAIRHNLKEFKKIIGKKTLLMPVIKANAYGHGFLEVAHICDHSREVGRLCVVNLDEALTLIKNKIKKPIQILSFFEPDEKKIATAIKNKVRFPVYEIRQARLLNRMGERLRKNVLIHLKLDAGTTRIGILPENLPNFLKNIKELKRLEVEGVFSHFSSSEDNPVRTQEQNKVFAESLKIMEDLGVKPKIKHISCTAATALHQKAHFDAVRVGLGIYGLHPSQKTRRRVKLIPALKWQTQIIQVKNIKKGTKIGYSGSYAAPRDIKIAALPLGYFDGYSREFSNKSYVMIKNKKCPVRGKICMNLSMVEIPSGLNVKSGDTVEIIGTKITADELAKIAGTINYEITTKINPLLPRLVI